MHYLANLLFVIYRILCISQTINLLIASLYHWDMMDSTSTGHLCNYKYLSLRQYSDSRQYFSTSHAHVLKTRGLCFTVIKVCELCPHQNQKQIPFQCARRIWTAGIVGLEVRQMLLLIKPIFSDSMNTVDVCLWI